MFCLTYITSLPIINFYNKGYKDNTIDIIII